MPEHTNNNMENYNSVGQCVQDLDRYVTLVDKQMAYSMKICSM